MSWKTPHRPKGEVTQAYNDGVVTVYAVTDAGPPGGLPVEKPVKKAVLRYEERRLGLQRYYEGKQNQVEVERVLRTPRRKGVSSQDLAVTEDGQQYRIDLVQSATDVYPPSMDLTLTRITQKYDVSNSNTGEGAAHGLA
ncbi:MAG TPA: phage head closure protein [Candidatus Intestinimonas merdavium]|uniref:Phage head closure protein n=1 Tax=Candidatus Intestinimonas merdavium TaxID=2838622 RepID=A0A9D2CE26_9FIRM|nr:phage head closure protein [Candidatus Intestinimonas merdavium]